MEEIFEELEWLRDCDTSLLTAKRRDDYEEWLITLKETLMVLLYDRDGTVLPKCIEDRKKFCWACGAEKPRHGGNA